MPGTFAFFAFVNSHPVKSEMFGATPKSQTAEPIQLDIVIVCRKESFVKDSTVSIATAFEIARNKISRLQSSGFFYLKMIAKSLCMDNC